MKTPLKLLMILLSVSFMSSALPVGAAAKSAKKATIRKLKKSKVSKSEQSNLGAKVSTDHQFDELSVHGHYQSAFEGVATVEDEKELVDLLDYRTHYKDRLAKSAMQR